MLFNLIIIKISLLKKNLIIKMHALFAREVYAIFANQMVIMKGVVVLDINYIL